MTIIERIFLIMKEKGLKQKELATATNKNESQITSWKNRNCNPPAELLPDIAKFLNVSINYLVTGQTETNNNNFNFLNSNNDEAELLKNYQKLDQRGKHKVHTIIYEELDRIEAESSGTQKHA